MDIPTEYPDGAGNVYIPINYDKKFHGPVLLRIALANSYNIPPVKAQAAIGTNALLEISERLGITTLNRNDYGLSLTLGSGEIPQQRRGRQHAARRAVEPATFHPGEEIRRSDAIGHAGQQHLHPCFIDTLYRERCLLRRCGRW